MSHGARDGLTYVCQIYLPKWYSFTFYDGTLSLAAQPTDFIGILALMELESGGLECNVDVKQSCKPTWVRTQEIVHKGLQKNFIPDPRTILF